MSAIGFAADRPSGVLSPSPGSAGFRPAAPVAHDGKV